MERGGRLSSGDMRWQKFAEIGERGGATVSCREVLEIRRNEKKGGAAVSYHEMQDNGRNGLRGEISGS